MLRLNVPSHFLDQTPDPNISRTQLTLLTSVAMLAFAANSLLCREALASGHIGAASFTLIRMASGAAVLGALLLTKHRHASLGGDWFSAVALFSYAAAFSFAYSSLSAGTGALLLFGAVQVTMIAYGLVAGERLVSTQVLGVLSACGGLVWLMLPGVEAPPLLGAALMLAAGVSWGVYSLLGKRSAEPTMATAGNFIRCLPLALILFAFAGDGETITSTGVIYAIASGALASGLGYALWYAVLPALPATTAATLQLSVPIIASVGGVVLLNEAVTLRFGLASIAVIGGISLVLATKQRA